MRTTLQLVAILAALLLLPISCQDLFRQTQTGILLISLQGLPTPATRASGILDSGDFLLTVADANGKVYYQGPYAQSPDELTLPAGTYTVSAESAAFETPAFDTPQWGDVQVVTVAAGSSISVTLTCTQLNSGLRLEVQDSFRQAFPEGKLLLKAAEGCLDYGYTESRTAFFHPGAVSISLEDGNYVQPLFTRTLEARQIQTVRLSASIDGKSGGISLQVDTNRTRLTENYVYGSAGAESIEHAYEISAARNHAGEKDVWVCGYIVGVATSSGKASFTPPFTKDTNLVLGAKAATTDTDYCLSVELPKGEIRAALNLVDNPQLLGRKVYIRGDLVSAYYGIPGLKAPSEYKLN